MGRALSWQHRLLHGPEKCSETAHAAKPEFQSFYDTQKDIAFVTYDGNTRRFYYGCLDKKGVYHGDYIGQGSPSNIIGKADARSVLAKDAKWTKTPTQTFFKNEYEKADLYPLCQFLYDYEAGLAVYNKAHRYGGDYFYLAVKNTDDDSIVAYQDRDDDIIYGFTDVLGVYHGDYKARVTGKGLTEVY